MRLSQFEILQNDLQQALSEIDEDELARRRPVVQMFLGEYDYFEDPETSNINPVNTLNLHFSEYGAFNIALFNLVLAEKMAEQLLQQKEEENLTKVNYAINAINKFRIYLNKAKSEETNLEDKIREINKDRSKELNKTKYEKLNQLKEVAFQLYEPTKNQLRAKGIRATYDSIARELYPKLAYLNFDKNKKPLIGSKGDPEGSLAEILRKARRANRIKSPRD